MKQKNRKDNQQHIGDAIKDYLETYRLQPKLTELELKNAWESIMGTSIAGHTTELVLKKKVLMIKLNSSVLRQELSYGREKITRSINEHFQKKIVDDVLLM